MLIDPSSNIPSKQSDSNGSDSANDDKLRSFLKGKGVDLNADLLDFEFLTNPFGIKDWIKKTSNLVMVWTGIVLFLIFLVAYRLSKNVKLDIPVV